MSSKGKRDVPGGPRRRARNKHDGIVIRGAFYPFDCLTCEGSGTDGFDRNSSHSEGKYVGYPCADCDGSGRNPALRWFEWCAEHDDHNWDGDECATSYFNEDSYAPKPLSACRFRWVAVGVKKSVAWFPGFQAIPKDPSE